LIAISFGDQVIERPKNNMSADGVHPTYAGYKELGNATK
jgi:lysophospholipase L1-like esterase